MAVSVFSAAKYLCRKSGYSLSSMELQRLVYMAHMTHLGEYQQGLIRESFEAWENGPIQPELYNGLTDDGKDHIKSTLKDSTEISEGRESAILDQILDQVQRHDEDWLISLIHWQQGAWSRIHQTQPDKSPIPDEALIEEYQLRLK